MCDTHLIIKSTSHSANTIAFRADVYNEHPSHDWKLLFQLDAQISLDDGELIYDRVQSTAFKTVLNNDNYPVTYRNGLQVDPYHLKNALEMVLEHLGSGEIERLEDDMLMCEGIVTERWA